MEQRRIVGCMSGTSIDALDVALVRIQGRGLGLRAQALALHTCPLGPTGQRLRTLADQTPMTAAQIAHLARELAERHVVAVRQALGSATADLIVVHGQTVFHAPPASWQLLCAAPLAHALGTPVLCDLRAGDLAAGGQGAPITPLADFILLRSPDESRAIVNLGGFCNVTILPPAPRPADATPQPAGRDAHEILDPYLARIRAADICACNQLLDGIARRFLGRPYDDQGAQAAGGTLCPAVRDALFERLSGQAAAGRSLGTGDELSEWIESFGSRCTPQDLARSACDALGCVIARSVGAVDRVLLAGGGTRHRILVESIRAHAVAPVHLTDDYGVPASYREAMALAVLGALAQDGVPLTLPQVTGRSEPLRVQGAWYTVIDRTIARSARDR